MGRRLLAGVGGVVVAIVLASCSENGLLTPLSNHSSQVTISSVADGTMVTNGDKIPLSVKLNASQATPTDLKVDLLSSSGQVVQSADITNVDFSAPLPSVALSSLSNGTYTLQLTLDGANNQVLAQKKISIFYVGGTYSLDGITSYPPTLPPGGSGLIVARIATPQGANPYLRWSMGGKVLATGYLNAGFDKIQWNAPSASGVYSITVQMFPFGPPQGGTFDFTSPYKMTVEVFVSGSASSGKNELGPSSSYYALYHFQGNLKNTGSRSSVPAATAVGNPTLAVSGSVFGYQLDGQSGFKIDSLLLPVDAKGHLLPASLTMRLRLDKVEPDRSFFSTSTSDGGFSFEVKTNSQGELTAIVDGTEEPGGVPIKSGDVTSVTLSILPTGGALQFLWFIDGKLSLSDSIPIDPAVVSSTGSSLIGGPSGFTGLIDELGIYYKDSQGRSAIDPEVYRRAMADEYGSSLVFAEGFDGTYLPPDLSYSGKVDRGQLAGGLLALGPGQSVTLPQFSVGGEALRATLELRNFSSSDSGTLSVTAKGTKLFSAPLSGAVGKSGELQLSIAKRAGGLEIGVNGESPTRLKSSEDKLQLSVSNSGKAPIDLRSFLIVKKRNGSAQTHTSGTHTAVAQRAPSVTSGA